MQGTTAFSLDRRHRRPEPDHSKLPSADTVPRGQGAPDCPFAEGGTVESRRCALAAKVAERDRVELECWQWPLADPQ